MKRKFIAVFIIMLILALFTSTISGCKQQPSNQSPAAPGETSTLANSPTSTAVKPSASINSATTSSSGNKEIMAFAGSSAKAALDAAGAAFSTKTGIKVLLTYGGSGTLLSQITLSKIGDLFIPASPDYIAKATKDNIIFPETETKLYYLVPAILVQKGNPLYITSLSDLSKPGIKVTIADPKTVPAGLFAYELLEYNKMLTSVGKNIVTYGDSNEKITSYVILKSVDAAIGWDNLGIQQPDKLDVVYLQPNQIPRLSYMSGAVTTFNKDRDSAQKFLEYLTSTEGQQFFKKFRYYTTESEAKKFAPNAQIGGIYTLPAEYTPLVK